MHSRLQHVILGALAGLFFWALSERGGVMLDARGIFALGLFGTLFFGAALAMLGEIGLPRALGAAIAIALPATLLGWWEAGAFDPTRNIVTQMDFGLLALLVLGFVPLPFAMVVAQEGRGAWGDYPALFTHAWNIVVRYAAAWLFLAVVWLLLFLSAELLESVGIDQLRTLFREEWLSLPLSGAVLGLGLAVVTELEEMISPFLILRLLRLLAPIILVVVVVFVAALVVQQGVVGVAGVSDSETLIAMSIAAVTLVSVAVEREDFEAVHTPVLRGATLGLALILPVLAAVAGWIEAQSIAAYGWTPARVAEVAMTLVLGGYGIGYAGSATLGPGWMARIRRVNIAMAIALIALAVLWLTPLITPTQIATRSQIARYQSGEVQAEGLPLRAMARDWGRAGVIGLARLRELGQGDTTLLAALDRAGRGVSDGFAPLDPQERIARLRRDIALPPGAEPLPPGLIDAIAEDRRLSLDGGCVRGASGAPGCAVVLAELRQDYPGPEAILIADMQGREQILYYYKDAGHWHAGGPVQPFGGQDRSASLLPDILAGKFQIVPSGVLGLRVGDSLLVPGLR